MQDKRDRMALAKLWDVPLPAQAHLEPLQQKGNRFPTTQAAASHGHGDGDKGRSQPQQHHTGMATATACSGGRRQDWISGNILTLAKL